MVGDSLMDDNTRIVIGLAIIGATIVLVIFICALFDYFESK
jgi:multisubunit Na+/H+ antiporter MnhC subunit